MLNIFKKQFMRVTCLTVAFCLVFTTIFNAMVFAQGEAYSYGKTINYNSLEMEGYILADTDIAPLGFCDYKGLAMFPGNNAGKLQASWAYLNGNGGQYGAYADGNVKPYAVYSVKPGTDFKAVISYNVNLCSQKENAMNLSAGSWTAKLYFSENGESWTLYNGQPQSAENDGKRTDITEIHLGSNVSFVKIELPHTNDINIGYGNDFMGIDEVGYTPIYERMINYNSMPNTIEIIGGADEEVLGLYDYLGMSLAGFGSGKALSASYGYLIKHPAYDTWNGNPYAVYEVSPGTDFKAVISYNKTICDNITDKLGESWVAKLYFSENGEDWTLYNGQLTSKENDGIRTDTFEAELGSKVKYVKIELPHTGRMDEVAPGAAISVGNDYMGIEQVCFTPYKEIEIPDDEFVYEKTIEYISMPNMIEIISGADEEVLGLYDHLGMSLADFGSGKALSASYGYLIKHPAYDTWKGNPYAVYNVKPGTDFKAVISYAKSLCDKIDEALNTSWNAKLFLSENGEDWTLYDGQKNSNEKNGIRTDTIEIHLSDKIKFVKIELPHTGRMDEVAPGAANSVGNDYMGIQQIGFTPYPVDDNNDNNNNYAYGKSINYNSMEGIDGTGKALDMNACGLFSICGVTLGKYAPLGSNVYLGAEYAYLYFGVTEIDCPYAIYNVKPGTDFKTVILYSKSMRDKVEAKLGKSWTAKIYVSSDMKEWKLCETEKNIKKSGSVITETIELHLDGKVNFVKLELPHTGDMSKVTGGAVPYVGNDFMGIKEVCLTPGNYDPNGFDPYSFDTKIEYNACESGPLLSERWGALGIIDTALDSCSLDSLHGGDIYLAANYAYLMKNKAVEKPYVVYNTVPNTAFRVTVRYIMGVRRQISKFTGKSFEVKLYVSKDNKNWEEASVEIEKSYLTGLLNEQHKIVIPNLGDGIKFVKLVFPQTGDMSLIAPDVTPYVGNDFVGVQKVEFTRGNDIQIGVDLSKYKFTDKYDYKELQKKKSELAEAGEDISVITMGEYWKNSVVLENDMVSASYIYLWQRTVRDNPAIVYSVKGGTPFYLKTYTRPEIFKAMSDGEFEMTVMISSDGVNYKNTPISKLLNEGIYFTESLPKDTRFVKVVFPQTHDYTDYITSKGVKLEFVGNDYIGITNAYFTGGNAKDQYKHILDYREIYEENEGLDGALNENSKNILGVVDYLEDTLNAQSISDTADGSKLTGFVINPMYLQFETKVAQPYVTYEVVPGTAFKAEFALDAMNTFKYSESCVLKVLSCATNSKNPSDWKEITDSFSYQVYDGGKYNTFAEFSTPNVGSKTNYIKILYPQTGDLSILSNGGTGVGADYFALTGVKATLKNYSAEYNKKEEDYNFIDSMMPKEEIVIKTSEKKGLTAVQLGLIIGGAALLTAACVFTVVFIYVKKRKRRSGI